MLPAPPTNVALAPGMTGRTPADGIEAHAAWGTSADASVDPGVDPGGPSAARLPALQALGLQLLALLATIPLALRAAQAGIHPAVLVAAFALLQGVLAAALARWRRLPSWWLVIQFVFPLALVGASALALPRWIYLIAFLLLLLTYWSTFRTRVPLYNCGPDVWREVGRLLPPGPVRFVDIGSGLGGIVLHLAGTHPRGSFTGIEIAPLPWLVSRLRAAGLKLRARRAGRTSSADIADIAGHGATGACRFVRGDYLRHDFSGQDVVFAYLSPVAMPALWQKACAEMRPGALLLSLEFAIPGVVPDFLQACGSNGQSGKLLYGFRMPLPAASVHLPA
jgi:hypothetical protein